MSVSINGSGFGQWGGYQMALIIIRDSVPSTAGFLAVDRRGKRRQTVAGPVCR